MKLTDFTDKDENIVQKAIDHLDSDPELELTPTDIEALNLITSIATRVLEITKPPLLNYRGDVVNKVSYAQLLKLIPEPLHPTLKNSRRSTDYAILVYQPVSTMTNQYHAAFRISRFPADFNSFVSHTISYGKSVSLYATHYYIL